MRKGMFFVLIICFVFYLLSDSGTQQDIDAGADGIGYGYFTKIRKDIFEHNVLDEINKNLKKNPIVIPLFSINEGNLDLSIENMEIKAFVDYFIIGSEKEAVTVNLGFKIYDIISADFSGSFIAKAELIGISEETIKEELIKYLKNRLSHLGIMDVSAEINFNELWDAQYMKGVSFKNVSMSGWKFTADSVLKVNGLNEHLSANFQNLLFSRIGKQLTANIFSSFESNSQFLSIFKGNSVNCLNKNFCSIKSLLDYSCIDIDVKTIDGIEQKCYERGDCKLLESEDCREIIDECEFLSAECQGVFNVHGKKIIGIDSKGRGENTSIYLTGNPTYTYNSSPAFSFKITDRNGKEIKSKGGYCPEEGCKFLEIADTYPAWSINEKISPMDNNALMRIQYSKTAIGKIFEEQVRKSILEIAKKKEEEGDSMALIGEPVFNIVTGNDGNNYASIKIKIEGTSEDGWSESDYSFTAHIKYLPVVEWSVDGSRLIFQFIGATTQDIDVDSPPWVKFVHALTLYLFSPTDLVSYGLSEIVLVPSINALVLSMAEDKIDSSFNDISNVSNGNIEKAFRKTLDPVFGEKNNYNFISYFKKEINGNFYDEGLVIEVQTTKNIVSYYTDNYFFIINRDRDNDGVKDVSDNCPGKYNPYQSDLDGDGIGNICDGGPKDNTIWIPVQNKDISLLSFIHDYDGDGIANTVDNCPEVKNSYREAGIHNEMISGICKNGYQLNNDGTKSCILNGDGGAIYDKKMSKSVFVETGSCFEIFVPFWQPDHDLDGIGDKCDHVGGVTYSGNEVKKNEAGSFSLEVKTSFMDVDDPARKKNCFGYQNSTCSVPLIKNRYIDASVNMNTMPKEENSPNSTAETLTQKFCWVDNEDIGRWGNEGLCTTTEGKGLRVITPEMKYIPVYGYSHGSDPKPLNFEFDENWKDPHWKDGGVNTQKCKKSCVFTWDWRENLESEYYDLYDDHVVPVDEKKENGENVSFITYVFSSGVQSSEDQKYMTGTGTDKKINPLHFKNSRIYARSKRDTFGGTDISYYRGEVFEQNPFYYGWFDIDLYLEIHGISPWWWITGPGMPFEFDNIDIYRYAEGGVSLIEKNMTAVKIAGTADSVFVGRDNITGIFSFNANSNQKVLMTTRDSDTAWSVGAIIEMPHYAGTVHKMAELIPGQDFLLMDSSSVYRFNTMSGFGDVNQPSFRVCSANIQVGEIGRLPFDGAMAEIIKLGNRVLIINKNAGELELYELDMVQGMVVPLEYENGPSGRAHLNFEVINGTLYVAGGAEISGTQILPLSDVYKFSFENGWTTVTGDTGLNLMGAVIALDNGLLKVYSRPFTKTDRIHVALIDENTGEINLDTEIIEGGGIIRQDYCIDDNGIDLFPGIEENGICRKVEKNDYEYSSYTFLDYKMSLAGSGNNLYIGGLTGLRRMEIGNDGSLKMKELVLAGHITSIAVSDDRLFGASVDSIKVFKLGSDGSVKFDRSVKASGCKDVRIRGYLLFAGMNGKVAVYDISNGQMNLIKNISVENNVEDLEIAGNNLFVYHEKGFWFWKKNALTKFDISDLNNTVRIGNRNMECVDAEMMKDESHTYLGCKNGQFRIDKSGSGLSVETVNGKKNYFRDSYVNDGIIYTVHSGRLFMSR